jgi:hypothetical protein
MTRTPCPALPAWVAEAPQLVGLIACGTQKLDRPAPAADLYTGGLFRAARRFVEAHCDAWGVLSTLYGAVPPEQVLEPYDRTLAGMDAATRRCWANVTRTDISRHWLAVPERPQSRELVDQTVFVVLAGKQYRLPFEPSPYGARFEARWWSPWADQPGMGIGRQRGWLKANTASAEGRPA